MWKIAGSFSKQKSRKRYQSVICDTHRASRVPRIHDDNRPPIMEYVLCCELQVSLLSFTINPTTLTLQTVTAHYIADNASTPQDRNNNSATPTRATTIVRLAFTTLTSLAQRKTPNSWQHQPEPAYDPTFEICRRKAITTGGMCEGGN